jgi:hypothetical protein
MKFEIYGKKTGRHELEAEKILTNDVIFPHEKPTSEHGLYLFGHTFGCVGAVWASHLQDAFDIAADEGMLDAWLVDEKELATMPEKERDCLLVAGNHSDSFNFDSDGWSDVATFDYARDFKLLLALAEARGAAYDNLGQL